MKEHTQIQSNDYGKWLLLLSRFFGILVFVATAYASRQHEPAQLWSIDLSADTDFAKRAKAEHLGTLRAPTLDFLDEDHIVVAFDDNSYAIEGAGMRPFGFHVLEVDARQGMLGKKRSWQVLNATSQALALGRGEFLVLEGERLTKFSSGFEELTSVPTPLKLHGSPIPQRISARLFMNPYQEGWEFDVSPGGTTVVLAYHDGAHVTVEWRRGPLLERTDSASFSWNGLKRFFGTDKSALVFVQNVAPLLVSSSGEQRVLCKCVAQMARVLTDDSIFVTTLREYMIIALNGEVRSSGKLNGRAHSFHRSADLSRFAYASGSYKGSGFPMRTEYAPEMTVHVLDTKTLKQVSEKTFAGSPVTAAGVSHGFRQAAIALSPDGHRLLVLVNATLSLYEIP